MTNCDLLRFLSTLHVETPRCASSAQRGVSRLACEGAPFGAQKRLGISSPNCGLFPALSAR